MGTIRVVGGSLGGRRLRAPEGNRTRPTSERVREAIASALDSRGVIDDARVLELYAGSGALGFEMLSRGAEHVVFVERDAKTARLIRENAGELGVEAQVEVMCEDATREKARLAIARRAPFTLLLADPPYRDVDKAITAITGLAARGLLAPDACILLEHGAKDVPNLPSDFELVSDYRYGDTAVLLLSLRATAEAIDARTDAIHEEEER